MINEFFDALTQRIAGLFAPLFDYLYLGGWYVALVALIVVCGIIGWFFDFKWVKVVLGVVVLIAGAFVAGGTTMLKHMRKEPPPAPPRAPKPDDKWNRW